MATVQGLPRAPAVPRPGEHTLTLRDGTELFYRAWLPERPTTKALLLFHRGHEHSGRWQETVAALGLEDVAVFAWDQRGHGRTPGERGSAPNLATVVHDVEEWVRHLSDCHGIAVRAREYFLHDVRALEADRELPAGARMPRPGIERAVGLQHRRGAAGDEQG